MMHVEVLNNSPRINSKRSNGGGTFMWRRAELADHANSLVSWLIWQDSKLKINLKP